MPVIYSATSGSGGNAGVWTAIVTINAVDVSSKIVGEIRIDAEEGSARIADLTIRPSPGDVFTIAAWVGKSITIDIADYITGTATSISRLFTGLIDTPELDLDNRTVALRCTDNLQNILEAMTNTAIDAAIPSGYASPVIFDRAARGWSRAQDRLSTVPAALDLTPAAAIRLTNWAPKVTPDLSFTDSHILESIATISFASRNQLVNAVDIDFGYRFPRVKAEGHALSFSYITNISDYVNDGNWFLQRAAVEAAIKAAGGTIESITWTALPTATFGSFTPGPYDLTLCQGFSAVVSFDYLQTTEEQFSITVSNPASITAVGAMRDRLSGALVGEYPQNTAAESAMLLYKNDLSGIPPQDVATPLSGFTTAAEVTLTTDTDRAAANTAMQSLIAVGKMRIWSSHRQNSVSSAVALNPAIDLDQTIQITVPSVTAKGKCRSVTHLMNPETGSAISEFTLAICSIAGTGTSHPDTTNTAPTGSTASATALATPATVVFNGLAAQDHLITITFPAVTSAERDRRVVPLTSSYSATITEDLLTITL